MTTLLLPRIRVYPESFRIKIAAGFKDLAGTVGRPSWEIQAACLVLTFLIALIDYLLGPEISLSVMYAVPILIAGWFIGLGSAFLLSLLNVAAWLFLNYEASFHFTGIYGAVESGLIRLFVFNAFAAVLVQLNHLQKNLETLAESRARALASEAVERHRLERDLLEISEREQQRIGRDLHDGLCQHLAGTALVSQLLAEGLSGNCSVQEVRARKVVDLVEEAISLARGIVKGLHPIEMQADGLMQALEEFASTSSRLFRISCRFKCSIPVLIHAPSTAAHLYRIAQEAVNNAIRHGQATGIDIQLEENEAGIRLCVSDNGRGFSDHLWNHGGIGLRSMAARAKFMNGQFSITASDVGGAKIICLIPEEAARPAEECVGREREAWQARGRYCAE